MHSNLQDDKVSVQMLVCAPGLFLLLNTGLPDAPLHGLLRQTHHAESGLLAKNLF